MEQRKQELQTNLTDTQTSENDFFSAEDWEKILNAQRRLEEYNNSTEGNTAQTLQQITFSQNYKVEFSQEVREKRAKYFAEEEQRQIVLNKREVQRIINQSNLPKKYRNKNVADFNTNNNHNAAIMLTMLEKNFSWFIFGLPGVGKTLLASIVANHAAENLRRVKFYSTTDLFYLLNPFNKNSGDKNEIRDNLRNAPLLILDDLGAEKATVWTNSILFDTINYRYNEEKQTIFTSNFNILQLQKRLDLEESPFDGRRIGRRIVEMCKSLELFKA